MSVLRRLVRLPTRARAWKAYVQGELARLRQEDAHQDAELDAFRREIARLSRELAGLTHEVADLRAKVELTANLAATFFEAALQHADPGGLVDWASLRGATRVIAGRRKRDLVLFLLDGDQVAPSGRPLAGGEAVDLVVAGVLTRAVVVRRDGGPLLQGGIEVPGLLDCIRQNPDAAKAWLEARSPEAGSGHGAAGEVDYFQRLEALVRDPAAIDLDAVDHWDRAAPPFDRPELLPDYVPAEPRRRSVVLLHNNYYHYNCLAAGLKARGWDAVTVALEAPDSPQQRFFHGEDINLWDPDPAAMAERIGSFFRTVPERFGALHFYGMGLMSFFPENYENSASPTTMPWDFLELRRHRLVLGYMPSGCLDGGLQSSIRSQSGTCAKCVWELRPDVCSEAKSLAWNRKLFTICDWVGLECDHATPERIDNRTVYGPVVTALDPARWHPEIEVPDDMRVDRQPGEVLIYHAVGNYDARRAMGRDIKGTGAVMGAVETLQREGLPVRLIFAHDIPSTRIRYLQVQADIIVDQLNYGRYGANAREAMMLGKPTICRLIPGQAAPLPPLRPIVEAPLVDADEDTVTDRLRDLVLDPERRVRLGRAAREFALAWHGQDACAARFEQVIDRIVQGLSPETPDLYPRASRFPGVAAGPIEASCAV